MKLDFSREILDLKGEPIKDAKDVALTLSDVSVNALLTQLPNDNPSGEEKFKAFTLAMKINDAKAPLDLQVEEVVSIKGAIGKLYTPLVVGRAFTLLEQSA